jgi:hypothetical protein
MARYESESLRCGTSARAKSYRTTTSTVYLAATRRGACAARQTARASWASPRRRRKRPPRTRERGPPSARCVCTNSSWLCFTKLSLDALAHQAHVACECYRGRLAKCNLCPKLLFVFRNAFGSCPGALRPWCSPVCRLESATAPSFAGADQSLCQDAVTFRGAGSLFMMFILIIKLLFFLLTSCTCPLHILISFSKQPLRP